MRQEAVAKLTTLLANKQIVNTPAAAELAGALKDRLGETNLNLRARVVQCIDALVKALSGGIGAAVDRQGGGGGGGGG